MIMIVLVNLLEKDFKRLPIGKDGYNKQIYSKSSSIPIIEYCPDNAK